MYDDLKIEDDIPIPVSKHGRRAIWGDMKIGQSVLGDRRAAFAAANFANRHPGVKFTTRTVEGGIRIWRVA